jgi:hypothetical protein
VVGSVLLVTQMIQTNYLARQQRAPVASASGVDEAADSVPPQPSGTQTPMSEKLAKSHPKQDDPTAKQTFSRQNTAQTEYFEAPSEIEEDTLGS